jgi:hypothetical protein
MITASRAEGLRIALGGEAKGVRAEEGEGYAEVKLC